MSLHDLPALNAALNGVATVLLVVALVFIKQGRIQAHRSTMIAAFAVSCIFLLFYVAHKIGVKGVHTPFGGEGGIRLAYFVLLFSHIILAMAIVPLALVTLFRGLKRDDARHKKIARITWPIWFYVSVTGVLVYFMLYVWFPHRSTLEKRAAAAAAVSDPGHTPR